MPYSIDMDTVYGNIYVSCNNTGRTECKEYAERAVKAFIRVELASYINAFADIGDLEVDKALLLLSQLDADLLRSRPRMKLDEIVKRLEVEIGWTNGPNASPSFTVDGDWTLS